MDQYGSLIYLFLYDDGAQIAGLKIVRIGCDNATIRIQGEAHSDLPIVLLGSDRAVHRKCFLCNGNVTSQRIAFTLNGRPISSTRSVAELANAGLRHELTDFYLSIQRALPASEIPAKMLEKLRLP